MIVYYHSRSMNGFHRDRTYCVDIPDKDVLEYMMKLGTEKTIMIPIGYTELHPEDQYVKRIGRELSLNRTSSKLFRLRDIDFFNDGLNVKLTFNQEKGLHLIQFHLKANSKRVYLTHAV